MVEAHRQPGHEVAVDQTLVIAHVSRQARRVGVLVRCLAGRIAFI
jgi:hypothetical protein